MTGKPKSTYREFTGRLGVEPDADEPTVLAALDETLREAEQLDAVAGSNDPAPPVAELPAEPATARFTPPPGLALVDQTTFDGVRDRVSELDRFRAQVAERVGLGAAADPSVVLEALDETVAEVTATAEGTEVMDSAELAELRADAELHRTARERGLVDAAVRDGRLRPFERARWLGLLQESPHAAEVLAGLPTGRVPVDGPIGYTGDLDDIGEGAPVDDYQRLFGKEPEPGARRDR